MQSNTGIKHPVHISDDGRYFVDQSGAAAFWLGTTQWQLFREFTLVEARTILAKSARVGFAFAQVMLLGVGDGPAPNINGDRPWFDDDPLNHNEAYFRHVDAIIRMAGEFGIALSIVVFHQRYRKYITVDNARAWAKWLAERYNREPAIVWSITPEAKQEFVPILRDLAAGLQEGDGGAHLITFKPDPSPYSSSFLHTEQWLDFNSMQTWASVELIYPMVSHDYNLEPLKPALMAEGAYEAGTEYSFEVTPLWIRRQAYYSYLAGAHHTYGHNDSWRVLSSWKQALDEPGAAQMGVLRSVFLDLPEWWRLVPDQALFTSGGNSEGRILNLAARHAEGWWALVYLASPTEFSIDLGRLHAEDNIVASWIHPETGARAPIGSLPRTGTAAFATPDGYDDALLLLERHGPLR